MIREKGLEKLTFRLRNAVMSIISYAYLMKKDYEAALEYFPESLTTTHALQVSVIRTHYIFFFLMLIEKGQLPKVTDLSMEKMIQQVVKTGNVHARGVGYLFKAQMLEKEGRPPGEILKALRLAAKWAKECGKISTTASMSFPLSCRP